MNPMVKNYIRCFCTFKQHDWDQLLPSAAFAYNYPASEDLELSPFKIDLVCNPKASIDILFQAPLQLEGLKDFRDRLASVFSDAQYSHRLAIAWQTAGAIGHCKAPPFCGRWWVWVSWKHFKCSYSQVGASNKLYALFFVLLAFWSWSGRTLFG